MSAAVRTAVSGNDAAQENQKWLPWTTDSSRLPFIGPSIAWPRMFHVDPVVAQKLLPVKHACSHPFGGRFQAGDALRFLCLALLYGSPPPSLCGLPIKARLAAYGFGIAISKGSSIVFSRWVAS